MLLQCPTRVALSDPPPDNLIAGIAAFEQGQFERAKTALLQSANAGEPERNRDLILGEVELQLGDLTAAGGCLKRYTASHPSDAAGWYALGALLFRENLPKESLSALEKGGQLRPPSPVDDRVGGADYVLLKDMDTAIVLFERSLAGNPGDQLTHYLLGRAFYAANDFSRAIAEFKEVLASEPRNTRAEDNLALALAGAGQPAEAERCFRAAIAWNEISPTPEPFALVDFGGFLLDAGRVSEGRAALSRALEFAGGTVQRAELFRAEMLLGRSLLGDHELAAAEKHFEAAVQVQPDDPGTHFLLGRVYREEGRRDDAEIQFQAAKRLMKPNGTAK